MAASCRMPGIFIPKKLGGRVLVDGGVVNNLPSDLAWAAGAEKVISCDLGYAGEVVQVNGAFSILKHSLDIVSERNVDRNVADFGIYLNPAIFDVTVLEVRRADECFQRGYEYGLKNIDHVLDYLAAP